MDTLSLSLVEILLLIAVAITLGITIHFFIVSRRSLKVSSAEASGKTGKELEDWKLRYFNDIELKEKELSELKKQFADTSENSDIYAIEAEEMRKQNKKLQSELESLRTTPLSPDKRDYIDQLRQAQTSLMEHNEKINHLLGQIDIVRETEEKRKDILKYNEELANQVDDLKFMLSQKEKEISNVRQKEHLTTEMTSMLDSAYNEFNVLQEKIQKLESQVNASKKIHFEYEDLKENHYKVSQGFEEQRRKYNVLVAENNHALEELTETEEKLREANFQRQQLQKRVAYLEELNMDLQTVSDANKKLEGQLKRVGELESMLNVISEERDELARKQSHG